jgi:YD repeat-containing protein
MPGWTLSRDSVQSPLWELRQDSGLVYFFDRAGRLVRYGFPEQDRLNTIDYPNPLNGAGELGEATPVIVTDAANLRRLELTYDDANHIVRSVLRETATIADLDAIDPMLCDSAENCFETTYIYDDAGYLTQVNYADGATARYSYDDAGRMSQHDDPRAPIAQVMTYDYGDDGQLTIQVEPDDGDPFVWQHLGVAAINDDEDNPTRTVTVTVTDEYGNHRAYSYSLAETTLKSVGDSYTLLSETSPLTDVTPIETVPIEYLWTNGLLERINTRRVDENIGRNSTIFEYAGGAALSRIRGGYPGFSVTYLANGTTPLPQTLSFADNTTLSYTYDPQGRIQSIVDRNGGAYRYSWDRLQRPTTVERNNDLTAVDYAYNELGLTESVTQRRFTDSPDDWYTVNYTYDGLGRLIGVSDPVTGDYAIDYRVDSGATVIAVTDATDTVTTSVFDQRGNLIETRIDPAGDVGFLRKTTYGYDALNRLTAETQWLDDDSSASPIPVTTAYDYTPLPVLPCGVDRHGAFGHAQDPGFDAGLLPRARGARRARAGARRRRVCHPPGLRMVRRRLRQHAARPRALDPTLLFRRGLRRRVLEGDARHRARERDARARRAVRPRRDRARDGSR